MNWRFYRFTRKLIDYYVKITWRIGVVSITPKLVLDIITADYLVLTQDACERTKPVSYAVRAALTNSLLWNKSQNKSLPFLSFRSESGVQVRPSCHSVALPFAEGCAGQIHLFYAIAAFKQSAEFTKTNEFCQDCSPLSFLFKLVI